MLHFAVHRILQVGIGLTVEGCHMLVDVLEATDPMFMYQLESVKAGNGGLRSTHEFAWDMLWSYLGVLIWSNLYIKIKKYICIY